MNRFLPLLFGMVTFVSHAQDTLLVEEFTMTFNSYFEYETQVLESGESYFMTIDGQYNISSGTYGHKDAAWYFCYASCSGGCNSTTPCPSLDEDNWNARITSLRPNVDIYDPNHHYEYSFTGEGESMTFDFNDVAYGDNGGALVIAIYAIIDQIEGCTDPVACNYVPQAQFDDGDCSYPEEGYACDGTCLSGDTDADGVCDDIDECVGQYDECGVCNGPGAVYECGCQEDNDGDGICDVSGCTDPNASNYDPSATNEDGSCLACQEFTVTLNDVFTDGWTYLGLTNYITLQGGGLDTTITLADGLSTDTFLFCADLSECIQLTYIPEDVWFGENSWVVEVAGEQVLVGSGTPTASVTAFGNGCVLGCTDSSACNYNPDAVIDDGTCVTCEVLSAACLQGTIWSEELGGCIVANPADINLDGCVQLGDLLDLLAAYGDCGVEESSWQCGDALEYQGYDYETVQIGEQCWFAENLRAENYRNGDAIPSDLNDVEWLSTEIGASAIWGQGSNTCTGENCSSSPNDLIDEFGRLYNWYATSDDRGLCPTNWSIPTDEQWGFLEIHLGLAPSELMNEGWRGNIGEALKSDVGWDGTNLVGFNLLPSGDRSKLGDFNDNGTQTHLWTTSENGNLIRRSLGTGQAGIQREQDLRVRRGLPIRCIKD